MHPDLRIWQNDWTLLTRHFESSFRRRGAAETGALALLGECRTEGKHEFIVVEVAIPGPGDLKVASCGEVVFDSSFIRRVHLAMRGARLAGIATFHTHPGADLTVQFSGYDDHQDPLLAENLFELEPRTRLVSVVVGKQSQCGRYFADGRSVQPLRRLIVVGDRLSYLPLDGRPAPPPPSPEEVFDRARALTGSGALSLLSRMTIAVVGASGTGSLVCELLARAGCKRIILIDHDLVRLVNLNRILYATLDDAKRRTPKVEVLRRGINSLGLGCEVEPIHGSILDDAVLRRVLDADLVFGCVDRALPRYLLCELAFRYLLPYVDLGSEIGGDDRGIVSLDGRVSYVVRGRHCLTCTGVVTPRRLNFESLTAAERKRKIALGYSDDLVITQPAVMDLNMRAASNGVLLLRHLLQPFLIEPVPVSISENAVTYRVIPVSAAKCADALCPTCKANPGFGYGDCGQKIGYDAETAKRLLDPDDTVESTVAVKRMDEQHWFGVPHFLGRVQARLGKLRRLMPGTHKRDRG
jgi:hypothetical protein